VIHNNNKSRALQIAFPHQKFEMFGNIRAKHYDLRTENEPVSSTNTCIIPFRERYPLKRKDKFLSSLSFIASCPIES
jgi:hypothetical protein